MNKLFYDDNPDVSRRRARANETQTGLFAENE